MNTIKEFIEEFNQLCDGTRKVLERVPDDKLDWQPHEKSMPLGKMAMHIANLPIWIERILTSEEFDFATANFKPPVIESAAQILEEFEKRHSSTLEIMQNTDDEKLKDTWRIRRGETVMAELPKATAMRSWTYNHLIHHRGQLTVYLRLLNIPVPGIYGPSADER